MSDFDQSQNEDQNNQISEPDWKKGRIFEQMTRQLPPQNHLLLGSHKRFLLEIIKVDVFSGAIVNINHRLVRVGPQQQVSVNPQINVLFKTNQSIEIFISEKDLELIRIIGQEEIDLQAYQMPLLLDTSSIIKVKSKDLIYYLRLVIPVEFEEQQSFLSAHWKRGLMFMVGLPVAISFFKFLPHLQPPEFQPSPQKRVARIQLYEVKPPPPAIVPPKRRAMAEGSKPRGQKPSRLVAQQRQAPPSTTHLNVKDLGVLGSITRHPTSTAQQFNPGSVIELNRAPIDEHVSTISMAPAPSNRIRNKNRMNSRNTLETASTKMSGDKTFSNRVGGLSVGNAKKSNLDFGNDSHSIAGDLSNSLMGSMVGGLNRASVLGAMKKYRGKIRTCYEDALSSNSKVGGKITYRWDISAEGEVVSVQTLRSEANYPSLEDCISGVIKSIPFPKAKNGQSTTVIYPFVLKKS